MSRPVQNNFLFDKGQTQRERDASRTWSLTHMSLSTPPTPTTPKCSGLKPPFYFAHSFAGQASGKGLVAWSFLRGLSCGYCQMLARWGAASEVQRRWTSAELLPTWWEPSGRSRLGYPYMVFPGRWSQDSQNFTSLMAFCDPPLEIREPYSCLVCLVESPSLPQRSRREDTGHTSQ